MRYGLPAVLVAVGLVLLVAVDDVGERWTAWAAFTGAGLSLLLLNVLHRMGVQGDRDRGDEEAARRYFDEHGRWPDE